MADATVPQEYGTTIAEKRSVGVKICHGLLDKVKYDINVARSDNEVDMRYVDLQRLNAFEATERSHVLTFFV